MKSIIVSNIQRMCFHDGPGIRTTVFTKGCSLHCPWCSNPENIEFDLQKYHIGSEEGEYGKIYTKNELLEEILKDECFWGEDGGVTFSGGEALMQADALLPLLEELKKNGVNIAVETALFIPEKYLTEVIPFIDYFIVDVKILDNDMCKNTLGGELKCYQKNVHILNESGKLKLFRLPMCREFTFTEKNRKELKAYLLNYPQVPIEVFSIHELGKKKYQSLGKKMWQGSKVEDTDLEKYCLELKESGLQAKVIRL